MHAYNEEQLEQEWQNDDIDVSFKSWLIEEINILRENSAIAAYQATCEAARAVYDLAIDHLDHKNNAKYSALIQAFTEICKALK